MVTSSERVPGKLQAADQKEEQHFAFSERGREWELFALLCKQFCLAFQKNLFLLS